MDEDHHLKNTATASCGGDDDVAVFGQFAKPNNGYFHSEKAQQEQTNGHSNKQVMKARK